MKTTLNINGKDVEITLTAEQVAKITKSSMKITDRIKTFEDACNETGVDFYEFSISNKNTPKDEKAFKMLKIITKALNEGNEIRPSDENQTKYIPYFDMRKKVGSGFAYSDCSSWYYHSDGLSARLFLYSKELAIYFGNQFEQIWYDYIMID